MIHDVIVNYNEKSSLLESVEVFLEGKYDAKIREGIIRETRLKKSIRSSLRAIEAGVKDGYVLNKQEEHYVNEGKNFLKKFKFKEKYKSVIRETGKVPDEFNNLLKEGSKLSQTLSDIREDISLSKPSGSKSAKTASGSTPPPPPPGGNNNDLTEDAIKKIIANYLRKIHDGCLGRLEAGIKILQSINSQKSKVLLEKAKKLRAQYPDKIRKDLRKIINSTHGGRKAIASKLDKYLKKYCDKSNNFFEKATDLRNSTYKNEKTVEIKKMLSQELNHLKKQGDNLIKGLKKQIKNIIDKMLLSKKILSKYNTNNKLIDDSISQINKRIKEIEDQINSDIEKYKKYIKNIKYDDINANNYIDKTSFKLSVDNKSISKVVDISKEFLNNLKSFIKSISDQISNDDKKKLNEIFHDLDLEIKDLKKESDNISKTNQVTEKTEKKIKTLTEKFKQHITEPSVKNIAIGIAVVIAAYTVLYGSLKAIKAPVKGIFNIVANIKVSISVIKSNKYSFGKKSLIIAVGTLLLASIVAVGVQGFNYIKNYFNKKK